MRRWAFIIFVSGVFVMFVLANLSPEEIESGEELSSVELNARVSVSGNVVGERVIYEGTRLIQLDNGIKILCECDEDFEGKEIKVVGKVSDYNGERQVTAEEIFS